MANFSYVAKDGSQKSVQAADEKGAYALAPDIAQHSGLINLDVASPPTPAIPAAAAPAPQPAPKQGETIKQPTGENQPPASTLPADPTAAAAPSAYTMKANESLEDVAKANGTNVQALLAANPSIKAPGQATTGSQLTIPQAKPLPVGNSKLSDVSKAVYGAVSKVPNQNDIGAVTAAGSAAVAGMTPAADPVSAAIAPIVAQMSGAVQAIMAPGPTYKSLAQEYQELTKSSGLEGLNLDMMNLKNVMDGTEDDIRAEVTASGGFASDSQIQALSTSRNNVLLKKYNALAAQQSVAEDYVKNTMTYATQDQAERDNQQQLALSKITSATGILDKMASLQATLVSTAQDQYNKIVTNVGYKGLSQIVADSPYQQALAEQALGLPQGTLSDADKVAKLQTYKDQQLAQGSQKIVLQYGTGVDGSTATGGTDDGSPFGSATTTVASALGADPTMPLSQAVKTYGADAIVNAMIGNEGGSPSGVANNPGNIKYSGLPGQTDSGVKATDGGTFASYKTPDEGKKAIASLISNAAAGKSDAYGEAPSLADFVGKYTNTGPAEPSTGTDAGNSITKATGLSINAFRYLTQGTTALTRMSAPQRQAVANEAQKFLDTNGLDLSTFQSRYEAYNQTLSGNIMRTNAAAIQENELLGTISNLGDTINEADLGKLKAKNVADLFAGKQVNDPLTTKYSTYLLSLQNELAGYNAAVSGKLNGTGGPAPDQVDLDEAAKVIQTGMSSGSLAGFKEAIQSQQAKLGHVLDNSVDASNKAVWNLFGVGNQYQTTAQKKSGTVDSVLTSMGLSYNQALSRVPVGQIGVIRGGQFGTIPPDEYNPDTDTKI